jgi:quinol monooxygenase YgiN
MSIIRINEFKATEGKATELFAFLKSLKSYIVSSAGCESCEVLQNSDDESLFVVVEKWDAKNSHTASLEKYPKEKMATAMPLIGGPPKGGFYHT